MITLRHATNTKRLILLFALLLICASLVASALALGGVTRKSDDYGIIVISSLSQNCPNGSEYDYSTGECVAINHDND